MNFSLSGLHGFLFARQSDRQLILWVRWFTISFFVYICARLQYAKEWLTDFGFHFTRENSYSSAELLLPTMPEWAIPYFTVSFVVATLFFLWKPRSKIAALLMLAFAIYTKAVDPVSAFTLNKIYVLGYLIYLLPVSSEVTSDGERLISVWPVRILQALLLVMYFSAGACKVFHGDWLDYQDVLYTQVQGFYRTDLAAWLLRVLPVSSWQLQMNLALTFELLAPLLIGVRGFRPFGVLMGIGFHMVIALTMHELIYFSFQMMTFYVLFLSPVDVFRVGWRRSPSWE